MPVIAGMIAVAELALAVRTAEQLAAQSGRAAEQNLLLGGPLGSCLFIIYLMSQLKDEQVRARQRFHNLMWCYDGRAGR